MPKGPGREWRKRKEPILDDEVKASIALGAARIHGTDSHVFDSRFYETLIYDGLKSAEEAKEISNALFRSANHLGVSMMTKIEKAAYGGWQVKFTAICKECGRAYIITSHPDRATMPYDPRRKRNETDHK